MKTVKEQNEDKVYVSTWEENYLILQLDKISLKS